MSVIGSRKPNPSGTKGVLSGNNGQRADSGKEGIRWIYSFGNKTGPRGARPIADFNVEGFEKIVGSERGPLPKGVSNVFDPNTAPLNGHYHKLPFDTILPRGLGIIEDGIDVVPDSPHGPGHVTIYPTEEMTVGEFNELYKSLPWEYGGKK